MSLYKIVSGEDKIFEERSHIALFGRSNVGKSSLINCLLGSKSAKSSNKPGKTVTFNFYDFAPDLFLVDLPGYGFAKGGNKHIEKLRKRLLWYLFESGANFRAAILVIDAKVGLGQADEELVEILREKGIKPHIVFNKIDRLNQKQKHRLSVNFQKTYGLMMDQDDDNRENSSEKLFFVSAKQCGTTAELKNELLKN